MKSFTLVCLFAVLAAALGLPEQYTDKFDNIDLEEILANRRLLVPYVKCVLGEGNCTPEGKELKLHMQDALDTECAKCTDAQKKGTKRVIGHLINKEPELWKQVTDKYDPEQKYAAKYEKELKELSA